MKPILTIVLAAALCATAGAQPAPESLEIERRALGSGEPGQTGFESAVAVAPGENTYHVPQYLPGFPTAATLWPRIVRVRCRQAASVLQCEGYQWIPAFGRAEYLYFVPEIVPGGSSQ
jgi:hypothetical protein